MRDVYFDVSSWPDYGSLTSQETGTLPETNMPIRRQGNATLATSRSGNPFPQMWR
jgi:cysteinyl-tRNA synthetase